MKSGNITEPKTSLMKAIFRLSTTLLYTFVLLIFFSQITNEQENPKHFKKHSQKSSYFKNNFDRWSKLRNIKDQFLNLEQARDNLIENKRESLLNEGQNEEEDEKPVTLSSEKEKKLDRITNANIDKLIQSINKDITSPEKEISKKEQTVDIKKEKKVEKIEIEKEFFNPKKQQKKNQSDFNVLRKQKRAITRTISKKQSRKVKTVNHKVSKKSRKSKPKSSKKRRTYRRKHSKPTVEEKMRKNVVNTAPGIPAIDEYPGENYMYKYGKKTVTDYVKKLPKGYSWKYRGIQGGKKLLVDARQNKQRTEMTYSDNIKQYYTTGFIHTKDKYKISYPDMSCDGDIYTTYKSEKFKKTAKNQDSPFSTENAFPQPMKKLKFN